MLIATRTVTRQMNESKGSALLTQAQALQRDFNNTCALNDGITRDEIKDIVTQDKIFADKVDEVEVGNNSVTIPLDGTKFSTIIAPNKAPMGIFILDGERVTASTSEATDSGFIEIILDCAIN